MRREKESEQGRSSAMPRLWSDQVSNDARWNDANGGEKPGNRKGKGRYIATGRSSMEVGTESAFALVRAQQRAHRLTKSQPRVVSLTGIGTASNGVRPAGGGRPCYCPRRRKRKRREERGSSIQSLLSWPHRVPQRHQTWKLDHLSWLGREASGRLASFGRPCHCHRDSGGRKKK